MCMRYEFIWLLSSIKIVELPNWNLIEFKVLLPELSAIYPSIHPSIHPAMLSLWTIYTFFIWRRHSHRYGGGKRVKKGAWITKKYTCTHSLRDRSRTNCTKCVCVCLCAHVCAHCAHLMLIHLIHSYLSLRKLVYESFQFTHWPYTSQPNELL